MKYLHVMTMGSPIYNNMIIEMINVGEWFDKEEHEFVFTNSFSYDVSKEYQHVKLQEDYLDRNLRNVKNDALKYDYIFMHNLNITKRQFFLLDKKTARRIIWCVWGSDLYNRKKEIPFEFSLYRKLRRMLGNFSFDLIQKPKIMHFNSIIVGFTYDEIEVRKLLGKAIRVENAQYGLGYDFQMVTETLNHTKNKVTSEPLRIMIGHSAYPFLNHISILNDLEKFKNENIEISIPLSYGDKNYAQKVIQHANNLFKDKVRIITEYMDPKTYLEYLATVDIAIFDLLHQAALANIYLLLYMKKKIYLHSEGIVFRGLTMEKVKVFEADSLREITYKEFSNLIFDYSRGEEFGASMIDPNIIIKKWKSLFCRLEKGNNYIQS